MAEEIRARIVFDTRGLAGAAGTTGIGRPDVMKPRGDKGLTATATNTGTIAKGVFLGNALLAGVKSLMNG